MNKGPNKSEMTGVIKKKSQLFVILNEVKNILNFMRFFGLCPQNDKRFVLKIKIIETIWSC